MPGGVRTPYNYSRSLTRRRGECVWVRVGCSSTMKVPTSMPPLEQAQWVKRATKLNARCSSDVVPRRDYVSVYAMAISADCSMHCAFGIRPSLPPLGTWTKGVPSKNNRTRVHKEAFADSVPLSGRTVRRRLRHANATRHDARPSACSCSPARSSRQLSSPYSCFSETYTI